MEPFAPQSDIDGGDDDVDVPPEMEIIDEGGEH